MRKGKYYGWLLLVLTGLLTACGDDYHYPSVKLEFLTATSGVDGRLKTILTDEGKTYTVVEDLSKMEIATNSSVRIVSNYELVTAADGSEGVKLYATLTPVCTFPLPPEKFENGVKTDPVELQSIWLGRDYLNLLLGIKAQDGKHLLHFVEDEVTADALTGLLTVHLTLYHDNVGDVQAYTRRAYASVPLFQYAATGAKQVKIYLTVYTYSGGSKTYEFDYIPNLD